MTILLFVTQQETDMGDAGTPARKSGRPSSLWDLMVEHEIEAGTMGVSDGWNWLRFLAVMTCVCLTAVAAGTGLPDHDLTRKFWLGLMMLLLETVLGLAWIVVSDRKAGQRYLAMLRARRTGA